MSDTPTLGDIKRRNGVAGLVSYSVTVTYEGEDPFVAEFSSYVDDEPAVVFGVSPLGHQKVINNPGRFGPFNAAWVRRFFAAS